MSRARKSRRGGRSLLGALLVLALAGGGTFAYVTWGASADDADSATGSGSGSGSGSGELTVRYRNDAPAGATAAKPWLEVVNDSDKTVSLRDVTLRYWFKAADGDVAYSSNCLQTSLGCSHVTQRIGTSSGAGQGADRYLQLGFTQGAGELAPGKSTEAIGLQLFRRDGKALRQSDDYSFDADLTHYAPTERVTAYVRGAVAWGEEPKGATAVEQAAATGPSALPSGVLFDNFHYSGAGDPALAANGWKVRTGEGGPGVRHSWSGDGVGFPSVDGAQGGQAMRLRVTTDGTQKGTSQSELQSAKPGFFTGTMAARVYFDDQPVTGRNGDHVNQNFFALSQDAASSKYSELDYEYMPNGGWGAPGPRLDTTSWRSAKQGDRTTRDHTQRLKGWHTMMITAMDGKVTYSVDGRALYTHNGYFPRERMGIHFSTWLVDLPFKGDRTWDMKVNWVYCEDGRAVSKTEVEKKVAAFYANGTHHIDTLPKS